MDRVDPVQLQKALLGVKYPAAKQELVRAAQRNGADESILGRLMALPEQQYDRPADVIKAVQGR